MENKMYEQFTHITNIDSSPIKSIFMHLSNVSSTISSLKFNSVVMSLKDNEEHTLVFSLNRGDKIPLAVYNTMFNLFTSPTSLTEGIIINIEISFNNNISNIIWEDGNLHCPENLQFLFSDNQLFNFFTDCHNNFSYIELFEKLFKFLIKKELSSTTESLFKIQLDKYYAKTLQEDLPLQEVQNAENDILMEKLKKHKNDIFARIDKLTSEASKLNTEKEGLSDYTQNKESYTIEYDNLKHDYLMLIDQSKSYFKNQQDLKKLIEKISHELNDIQIYLNMDNVPDPEKEKMEENKQFLLSKKVEFTEALTEAEASLTAANSLITSTKASMELLYNKLNVISDTSLTDVTTYDKELKSLQKEIEDLYLESSDIDVELNKLQHKNADFAVTKEYAELSNKGTYAIESNSIRTSLNSPIIPNSINTVYKYLLNLFLYHCEKNEMNKKGNMLTPIVLAELNIYPQTFFMKYSKDEVLIG